MPSVIPVEQQLNQKEVGLQNLPVVTVWNVRLENIQVNLYQQNMGVNIALPVKNLQVNTTIASNAWMENIKVKMKNHLHHVKPVLLGNLSQVQPRRVKFAKQVHIKAKTQQRMQSV